MPKRRQVNMVVVGDPGVGKTSLILAVAAQDFPEHPVPTLPPTSLPAEFSPDGVPCVVVDTSSRPEDRLVLEAQCAKADVVLLLWSKGGGDSFKRLSDHWLPELRRMGVLVPIILVGARKDLGPDLKKQMLHQEIAPLMMQFKEVEVCLECSAKKMQFVEDVFYYAIKAVVHPTAPLFNTMTNQLRPACTKALKRIFVLCDKDRDGTLSDVELNAFQVHCWKTPLKQSELEGIKKVVSEKMPNGVNERGLTLPGFVFLHSLFIERGRLETTWAVLRSFDRKNQRQVASKRLKPSCLAERLNMDTAGYDDELKLKEELLHGANFSNAADQVVELTALGRDFFSTIFSKFDKDQDLALTKIEQDDMFSTAPCNPWEGQDWVNVLVETARSGALTLSGFLAKWSYMAMKDPRSTLANAMYLGYTGDASQLLCVSKRRRQERKTDQAGRSVLQCYVVGGPGVGKTGLLQGLVGLAHTEGDGVARGSTVAVGTVDSADTSKTLVMQEFTTDQITSSISGDDSVGFIARCDVAVFVFDSSSLDSFKHAQTLLDKMTLASGNTLPCLFVAAKDDLGMSQELVQQCQEACASLNMRAPVAVSLRVGETSSVYSRIVEAATHPQQHIPETPSLKQTRQYQQTLTRCLLYAGSGLMAGAIVYTVYHRFVKRKDS